MHLDSGDQSRVGLELTDLTFSWCANTHEHACTHEFTPKPACVALPVFWVGNMRAVSALYRLYLGIADGMSIARVWARRYSK